jgi:hypothetical protein
MGGALVRGVIAYFAMYVTLVLVAPVAFLWFVDSSDCPDGVCTLGHIMTWALVQAIIVAYTFGLASVVFFIPFMILFLVLTWLKAMHGALWVIVGALFAVGFGFGQRAFGSGPDQGGGLSRFVELVVSPPGLAVALVGAACGLAVWAADRRLKAM